MYARFTSRRTRMAIVGAAALSLGLSVAGMATAFDEDPAPAPAPVRTPSAEDLALTRRLAAAGTLMGIEVLDHLILGAGRFVSLKDRGVL